MRLARFQVDGWESYGLVEGDRVRVIQGDMFGEHSVTQASYALERVKLLPPTRPRTFWAVGLNYSAHVDHQKKALDADHITRQSSGFRPWQKGVSALIGHNDAIVLPPEADFVHYEGELVVVIGRPARRVSVEEARHYIFGFTIGNDVSSEGSWTKDLSNWRRKGTDTFAPVGPWVETDIDDPHSLDYH